MTTLWLLLPPSERKNSGGARRAGRDRFSASLEPHRRKVIDALFVHIAGASREELAKTFRANGELLDRSISVNLEIADGRPPLLPASRRYSGVVWEHLETESLPAEWLSHILVPSAVYGLNTARDLIADYRLTMNVSLPGIGNLARYWQEPITDQLERLTRRATVIDFLPLEHARAVAFDQLREVLRVRFLHRGGERAVGHGAKAVKGRFARHLLEYGLEEATGFIQQGWTVDRDDQGFVLEFGE